MFDMNQQNISLSANNNILYVVLVLSGSCNLPKHKMSSLFLHAISDV